MDLETQVQAILRNAGYATWSWNGGRVPVVCFEDAAVIGFVFAFPDAPHMLQEWQGIETATLAAHATSLRSAGAKAWNVYCVFLTDAVATPSLTRSVGKIEENLDRTRKIASSGVRTREDVVGALLPLLPLANRAALGDEDVSKRLRARLSDVPADAVTAFLATAEPSDVAHILIEET